MAKKIHLVNKKKGMSLVEMMASLAILLILFGGITSMILTNMKAEIKSNTRMENMSYIKAIMAMFEENLNENNERTYTVGANIFKEYLEINTAGFTFVDLEDLKVKIISGDIIELNSNSETVYNPDNDLYTGYLRLYRVNNESNLYKLDVCIEKLRERNMKSEKVEKTLYISREI